MRRGLFAITWMLAVLAGTPVLAQPQTLVLDADVSSMDLDSHLSWIRDTRPVEQAEQVMAQARAGQGFEPLPGGGPTFGFQSEPYWFHASVRNERADKPTWLLVQRYPLSDLVDVFLRHADGRIERHELGDRRPFSARSVSYRYPNVVLDLPPGETVDLLVRVQSESSMQVPLQLYTPLAFAELARDMQFGIGIYYGILISLLVFNLVLWLWLRDSSYFWYLFHIGGFGMVLFCLNGLGYEYLWPNSPQIQEWSVPVSISLALLGMQQFARNFLNTRQHWPLGDKLALGFIGFFTVWLVASFVLPYRITTPVASAAVFPNVALILAQTLVAMRRGFPPARIFLLAWAMFLTGTAAFAAVAFGLLPKNLMTEFGVQIGSAMEMLLLSIALGYRYANLRNENTRIIQEANVRLEREVQQRTGELRTTLQELGQAHEKLRETNSRDFLTGVHTRAYFVEKLEQLLAGGGPRPLSVMIVDLDHFKVINDTHGHLVGDDCLRWTVRSIGAQLRAHDAVFARLGGEEFIIALPGMDRATVTSLAEAMLQALRREMFLSGDICLNVTASIGTHTVTEGEAAPTTVMRAADQALYLAKGSGRDQVRTSAELAA